jgi:hypothetical protein
MMPRATSGHRLLHAHEVVTLEDELAACLQRASRVNLDSPSNRALARLIRTPRLLDYLERLVFADRERDTLREFAEAFISWVDNDAPVEEWDGGSLGYEVGGLYSMATDALERR